MKNFLRNTRRGWMIFTSPDAGGASGGSSSSESKPQEPTGETIELKLESSKKISADYHKQLSGAMSERDTAQQDLKKEQDAHGATKDLLKKEQDAHTETKGLLKKEQEAHSATKDQVTGANDRATKAEGRTTLIESFAKHNGLDLAGIEKFKAVTEVPEAGGAKDGKALYDQWQKLKAGGDGKKATAFFRKHKAALSEYAESTR